MLLAILMPLFAYALGLFLLRGSLRQRRWVAVALQGFITLLALLWLAAALSALGGEGAEAYLDQSLKQGGPMLAALVVLMLVPATLRGCGQLSQRLWQRRRAAPKA